MKIKSELFKFDKAISGCYVYAYAEQDKQFN